MKDKKNLKRIGIEYGILLIIVFFCICIVYRIWEFDVINIPLSYTQDGIGTLVGEKIIIEEGGLGTACSRLGAPYGQNTNDFATATILPVLLMKVGALFTNNWIWALNLSYFIGYFVVALITYYILRKISISNVYSMVLAVLYTFLPYHMLRGTEHFALAFYGLVPVSIYYVIMFMGEDDKGWKDIAWRKKCEFFVWMILIGLNGIYYSFFSCFLFCVAILYNVLHKNGIKNIIKSFFGICGIILGILIASIPNFIYIIQNGSNTETVYRLRSEIATYALRISQLLLPITGHRIKILAKIKEIYNSAFTVNENDSASLGIVFATGFIILCIVLIKENKDSSKSYLLNKLATLNLCMILYASIGGIVEVQAVVFQLIRCSNRISVFIAFVCCIAVGSILDKITQYIKPDRKEYKVLLLALVVLVLGVADQTKTRYVDGEQILSQMKMEREFIQKIEASEADGTMIFQLPNVVYPEQGMKERMGDYSHFIGYLYSDTLKWSYGAMRGREGSNLLKEISAKDTNEMIESMKMAGFGGIYIDRWGYKEDEVEHLEGEIEKILRIHPIEDEQKRYVYYSL